MSPSTRIRLRKWRELQLRVSQLEQRAKESRKRVLEHRSVVGMFGGEDSLGSSGRVELERMRRNAERARREYEDSCRIDALWDAARGTFDADADIADEAAEWSFLGVGGAPTRGRS